MPTKNITIEIDVYERLKALRATPSESFSKVLRRTLPRRAGPTGAEILAMLRDGTYPKVGWTDEEIAAIECVDEIFLPEGRDWR